MRQDREAMIVTCLTCNKTWDMNFDPEACTCQAGDELHQLHFPETGETLTQVTE